MRRHGRIIVLTLAVLAGLGTFLVTRAQTGRPAAPSAERPPLDQWLGLSAGQAESVSQADPDFSAQADALAARLQTERQVLAGMLDDVATSDEALMAQIERVIAAHDDLERRVARHLLAIRSHLSPDQQKRLLGLCADGVRQAARHRYRWGWSGQGQHRGPGGGGGRGGPRYRGGRGM